MNKGMLYCEARDTDCMNMYKADHCKADHCILDDPEYIEKEKRKERRRQELYKAGLRHKKEEKKAAKKIRRQTKTADELIEEEIECKRKQMERYYTKGLTKLGDRASRELAQLERRLK